MLHPLEKPVVLKFGGAALADQGLISEVAGLIHQKYRSNKKIIVVVSAMGRMTDELIEMALAVNPDPPRRELDMLISVGERISMSLLAMALAKLGVEATSFTGSQSGIITSSEHSKATILEIRNERLKECLQRGHIAIVAGFQGMSQGKEITTLGRGGSDTTAVALGCALLASHVEFYKDVDGVYDRDPKAFGEAFHFKKLSFQEAESIVLKGAKILHYPSLCMAKEHGIPLKVLSFNKGKSRCTWIGLERESTHELEKFL